MLKKVKFLECTGNPKPDKHFVLAYQRAVLLALKREGMLDQIQLEECVKKLELQAGERKIP